MAQPKAFQSSLLLYLRAHVSRVSGEAEGVPVLSSLD
jgi:hypothetical protein